MNAEEAKVPNVDGDWQSIEIFLFSNGQQYSPPRKYFISADELNLWDSTLKQLGQAHYGLQSPLIDLYTTDGQLVEGPLQLKDGQAYVAVALPDPFIDAGYEKYLLKASRSWEKRQARKKIPECVPGEPCCLCPDKDWCCDLQTCCLCAETEGADIPDPLRATDYPELGLAGGHYVNYAPAKPDDYEPKSSNIRPGEYGANSDKYDYSSALFQGSPDKCECETGPRLSKNGVKPREYGPHSDNGINGTLSCQDEVRESGPERYVNKKETDEMKFFENEKSLSNSKDTLNNDTGDTSNKYRYLSTYRKHSDILSFIGESELETKGDDGVKDFVCSVNGDEPIGRENHTGTGVGEPRPRKIENAYRLSEQVAGGVDYKRRSSELKTGEIDHIRRSSDQITPENEDRTSEPTREFELGGRVNEQKGEERNKRDDHVARLRGHESRVNNHDTGLGNSYSGPSAKADASGPKAPRDRINSRAKNEGPLKLGTTSTILNEAAARLNEADIKDRGTGAAGVQQQAQRTSLSMGRPSIEKKRLSSGQNSSLLRKPIPTSSTLRKSEDKKPMKTNKEILPNKKAGNSSSIPVSAPSEKTRTLSKYPNKHIPSPVLPVPNNSSTKLITKTGSLATDNGSPKNIIDEKQITDRSTHLLNNQDGEPRTSKLSSIKEVQAIITSSKETQTEPDIEKSMPLSVNKEVQTDTEAVQQQVCLCSQRDYRIATIDADDNIISIFNKGDIINLKLNIEVRNVVTSVHSSLKNSPKLGSLTNIRRSDKESQISIDDKALQCPVNDQHFQGYGFESSPKVMIVQCAGCRTPSNPPRRDPPPSCDNDEKYFVLLANSVHEDNTKESSNCNPPSRPCNQKQSQSRKPCYDAIPIDSIFSQMTLDTITTVTLSGVTSKKREMGNCVATNTSYRTEDPQSECVMAKRKVSITEDSGTKYSLQNQSVSSLSVMTYTDNLSSCLKTYKYEEVQVCSEFCPPDTSKKIQSVCTKSSLQICPKVQSKGCQPTCPQVQTIPLCYPIPTATLVCSQESTPKSIPCPKCCHKPPPAPRCPQHCKPLPPACPPCCPKTLTTPVFPQDCTLLPPTCQTCLKPPPTPVCLQDCKPSLTTCPTCGPKPPPTLLIRCVKSSRAPISSQNCTPPPPTCPKCCLKPAPVRPQDCTLPPCCSLPSLGIQIQTVCPQCEPQVTDAQTQTQWARLALQARRNRDGRYSFYLPPLNLLNNYPI